MRLSALACVVVVALTCAPAAYARKGAARKAAANSVASTTWKLDNLKKIGGNSVTVIGSPQVVKAPKGKAVQFDGAHDGLLLSVNPVAGAKAFTIEAVIRPDAGGLEEQRWMHIQESSADDRIMLETRLHGGEWFLDTFIKNGPKTEDGRTLFDEPFKHAAGQWYHVALVYDGATMKNYVDGKEELSGPLAVGPLEAGQMSIGVRQNRVFWFKGAISRLRFTTRALAPSEFMPKD
ncbi:MAG TPA: LamG domain-containing protein [Pyrinomonadaceae bacterium]|nr:LamG domain-containing protein [Pyrinomonadaceae bacterium]